MHRRKHTRLRRASGAQHGAGSSVVPATGHLAEALGCQLGSCYLRTAGLGSSPAALGSLRSCLLASASSRCALKASARRRGPTEHVRAGHRVLRRDRRAWMAPRGRYRGGEGSTNQEGLGELHVKSFGDLTHFPSSRLLGLKTDSHFGIWNSEIKGADFRADWGREWGEGSRRD